MSIGLSAAVLHDTEGATMLDLIMLALAAGLFALTLGYAIACDRL
jgi:hypothetical protein